MFSPVMRKAKRASGAKEVLRAIRLELLRRNMTIGDLAREINYAENTTHKVIQGWKQSANVRQAIEVFLNKPFWPHQTSNHEKP